MSNEVQNSGNLKNLFFKKDPSIQKAGEGVQQTRQSLDDYNPFAQNNVQSVSEHCLWTTN